MKGQVVNRHRDAYDVYIGRPSAFGNPFVIGRDGNREEVIAMYRVWLLKRMKASPSFATLVKMLAGKTLGCYCAPLHCHGDVLLEIAEGES